MLAIANTVEIGKGFGKNAGEWTGRVEISKEEIHGSKLSNVWLYTNLFQALKGERFSSVFSQDGTLISASAAPHCGDRKGHVDRTPWKQTNKQQQQRKFQTLRHSHTTIGPHITGQSTLSLPATRSLGSLSGF